MVVAVVVVAGCGGSGLWWQQVVVGGSNVHIVLKKKSLVNLQMKKMRKKNTFSEPAQAMSSLWQFAAPLSSQVVVGSGGHS